ncbi:MAG: hypothetical protein WCG81_11065 [Candidatus Angelobacter sp.]
MLSLSLLHPSHLVALPIAGLLLLATFFGVRKLGYHELHEFQRVWKRAGQQKRVFARDIALRKATTELRNLHDFDRVIELLEKCLRHDFDGFEVVLHPQDPSDDALDKPWVGPVQRVWKNGYEERLLFTLELTTPKYGLIGTLSMHRQAGAGWLVDTDLLAGDLQRSLGIAIENCILRPPAQITSPAFEAAV